MLLIHDQKGKIFETDTEGEEGVYYAMLENEQLRIYQGESKNSREVVWETEKPSEAGPYGFGISNSKKLIVFSEAEAGKRKTVWKSN